MAKQVSLLGGCGVNYFHPRLANFALSGLDPMRQVPAEASRPKRSLILLIPPPMVLKGFFVVFIPISIFVSPLLLLFLDLLDLALLWQ